MRKKSRGVERKKENASDNKGAVNESQPAAQTDKQLSWRVTELLQSRVQRKRGKAMERSGLEGAEIDKQSRLFGRNFLGSSETSLKDFY